MSVEFDLMANMFDRLGPLLGPDVAEVTKDTAECCTLPDKLHEAVCGGDDE